MATARALARVLAKVALMLTRHNAHHHLHLASDTCSDELIPFSVFSKPLEYLLVQNRGECTAECY